MSLANFFDKIALNATQVLTGCDRSKIEEILNNKVIGIALDSNSLKSPEGVCTIDLTIRLFTRLYPNISIILCDEIAQTKINWIKELALSINPNLKITQNSDFDICVCIGTTMIKSKNPILFLGSNGWVANFSNEKPLSSGNTNISIGAGAIACFGAANVFRFIFSEYLDKAELDTQFSLNLIDFTLSNSIPEDKFEEFEDSNHILLDKVDIFGIGAIGNGIIWALKNFNNLEGDVNIIDNQEVSLSNLQRYVLTSQSDIGKSKVEVAKEQLSNSKLSINSHFKSLENYASETNEHAIKNAVSCVDSGIDRIKIQSMLPKAIINGWTQKENLGISRHLDFINKPCLCCLYFPAKEELSLSKTIANHLGLTDDLGERLIRTYLANYTVFDEALLDNIISKNQIDKEPLIPFLGKDLRVFYSEAICGGIILKQTGNIAKTRDIEVPCAFQSALAGILLASEIILTFGNMERRIRKNITEFDLLKPLSKYFQSNATKLNDKKCICQDKTFTNAYSSKWNLEMENT